MFCFDNIIYTKNTFDKNSEKKLTKVTLNSESHETLNSFNAIVFHSATREREREREKNETFSCLGSKTFPPLRSISVAP